MSTHQTGGVAIRCATLSRCLSTCLSLALLLSCSLVIALQARKEGMVGCLDALFLCLRLYILCLVCASIHLPASMSWCPAIIVIVSVCMQQI